MYSLKDQIYIFDTTSRTTRAVAEGVDPCWSPDGQAIAYRSRTKDLMLFRVGTGIVERLTRLYSVIGFPRWSPDSQYVLFTESNPLLALRNPLTLPATEFIVIRIRDKATASVLTPGMGLDNRRFYWIKTGSK